MDSVLTSIGPDSTKVQWVRSLLLLVAMFLIFTPFEFDGSLAANYVVTAICVVMLVLIVPFRGLAVFSSPGVTLLFPAAMVLHSILMTPELSAYPLLLALSVIAAMLLVGISTERPSVFLLAIRALLIVNMGGLLFQYFAYQGTGEIFDLQNLIFPTSVTRTDSDVEGAVRLTGFHTEPGNYATWVTLLILAVRMVSARFGLIEYLATATIAMTLSATGVVFVGLLGFWMIMDAMEGKSRKQWLLLGGFIALIVVAVLSLDLLEHYGYRFRDRDDGSLMYRRIALEAYSHLSISERVLGFGFLEDICDCHFTDLGLGPNLFMRGGVLLLLAAVPWLWRSFSVRSIVSVLVVVTSVYVAKTPPFSMAAWFILLLLSGIAARQTMALRNAELASVK